VLDKALDPDSFNIMKSGLKKMGLPLPSPPGESFNSFTQGIMLLHQGLHNLSSSLHQAFQEPFIEQALLLSHKYK
jgi:hypothetical protein